MNRLRCLTRVTLLAHLANSSTGFSARPWVCSSSTNPIAYQAKGATLFLSGARRSSSLGAGGGSSDSMPSIRQVGKAAMTEIIQGYEAGGREDSGYVVIDVRGEEEVMMTGKVSPSTITLPLPVIMAQNVFALDEDDFEDFCGFEKPGLDETLVFTCAAGIRSQHAAYFAAQAGYGNIINYTGGANEWFSS